MNGSIAYRIPAFCLLLLCCSGLQPLYAQAVEEISPDTAILAPEILDSSSLENSATDEEQAEESAVPDTTVYRSVPDSVPLRLKTEKDFAYANDPDYWKKPEKKGSNDKSLDFLEWLFANKGTRFFMYFILAFILLYAVYRIIVNNNLFYNPSRKKAEVQELVKEEVDKDHVDALIAAAVEEKDYRKAVRFYFLKTLFNLDARSLIRYHPEGTNNEYLVQLAAHAKAGEFSYLTQVYEYVWYGGFTLQPEQFAAVEQRFRQFNRTRNS